MKRIQSTRSRSVSCKVCKESIKPGASKCVHCGSFQNWRRFIHSSQTVLALLVALVSVISFAIPYVSESLKKHDSNVHVFIQSIDETNGITLSMINSGTRDAIIQRIEFVIATDFDGHKDMETPGYNKQLESKIEKSTNIGKSPIISYINNIFGYAAETEKLLPYRNTINGDRQYMPPPLLKAESSIQVSVDINPDVKRTTAHGFFGVVYFHQNKLDKGSVYKIFNPFSRVRCGINVKLVNYSGRLQNVLKLEACEDYKKNLDPWLEKVLSYHDRWLEEYTDDGQIYVIPGMLKLKE